MATASARHANRRHLDGKPLAVGTEAYGELIAWRQKHMPSLLEPGGTAMFFKLITAEEPVPTVALFRNCGASAPKLRNILNELRRLGFVTVTVDMRDRRRELVEATDTFRRLARCYTQTMIHLLAGANIDPAAHPNRR